MTMPDREAFLRKHWPSSADKLLNPRPVESSAPKPQRPLTHLERFDRDATVRAGLALVGIVVGVGLSIALALNVGPHAATVFVQPLIFGCAAIGFFLPSFWLED